MPVAMTQLNEVINKAKEILKKLKENHPELRCYLVFSSRFGQGGLRSGVDLFTEFPEMFLSEELVEVINEKLKEKKKAEKTIKMKNEELERKLRDLQGKHHPGADKEMKELKSQVRDIELKINELLPGLIVKDDVFVEMRFEQLDYDMIEKLKKDPLVNQEYTDQAGRSIRLVLFRVND